MSNINIDINSTPQNVDVNVSSSIQSVGIVVSEFRGRSAYQVWLDAGNTGTVDDFFADIANLIDTGSLDGLYESVGSGILSGSVLNYIPIIVSSSSQLTSSYDARYILSGSITQTTWDNIENKPIGIVSSSNQILLLDVDGFTAFSQSVVGNDVFYVYTSSVASRLDSLEIESGSIRTNYNQFTQSYYIDSASVDYRLNNIELFSGSFSSLVKNQLNINTVVSSSSQLTASFDARYILSGSITTADWNTLLNRPIDIVSSSSQVNVTQIQGYNTLATTGSNIFVGDQVISGSLFITSDVIEVTGSWFVDGNITATSITASLYGTATTASYVDYFNIGNKPTLVSSSNQVVELLPGGVVSSSLQVVDILYSLNENSQSVNSRLDSIELETGSIRSVFNLYTSSTDGRLGNLELVSSSLQNSIVQLNLFTSSIDSTVKNVLNNENVISSSNQIQLNEISGSTFASTNFTFPQNVSVLGKLTAVEFSTVYVSSSVLYESGSTKFGDSSDDTHQFTGSVNMRGTLTITDTIFGNLSGQASTSVTSSYSLVSQYVEVIDGGYF